MRIVIDLDGVICSLRKEGQSYIDVQPLPGAVEHLRDMRAQGHTVIIFTARNMATYEGNLGKVMKNIGLLTLEWLDKNQIEYDEIFFGKPSGDVYIDDRALRFQSWEQLDIQFVEEGKLNEIVGKT